MNLCFFFFFFFQAEDGIRDFHVTGVQTCALPISSDSNRFKPCKVKPNHTTHGHSVRVPHGNFSQVRMTESFPTVTVSEIHPSSVMCGVRTARVFERSPKAL